MRVKVVAHEPQLWFLLEDRGRHYFDARVTRSAADFSVLVQLTEQESREYRAIGRLYLQYLAARIHNFVDEYASRDLGQALGAEVTRAIEAWRASHG